MNNIGSMAAQPATQGKYGSASPEVVNAIQQASAKTGVDFSYLMAKAAQESSFDPKAKAGTSSATGLYQFIDSTWLNVVAEHGEEHGLGFYADQIKQRDGKAYVADPAMKKEILELRKDPRIAALFAAEFAADNKAALEKGTGGNIGPTELYMAHFLGAGGANKFLNAMKKDPNQQAAVLFPDAAAANKNVFKGKTLQEVYDRFAAKFDQEFKAEALTPPLPGAKPNLFQYASAGSGSPAGMSAIPKSLPEAGQRLSLFTMLTLSALETPMDKKDSKSPNLANRVRELPKMTGLAGTAI